MIVEHQLGTSQRAVVHEAAHRAAGWRLDTPDFGLLGNQSAQTPSPQFVAERLLDVYHRLFDIYQPAFKLALLKRLKFTLKVSQNGLLPHWQR